MCASLLLGCNICTERIRKCGQTVGKDGTRGLSCLFSLERILRHKELNLIIQRALDSVNRQGVPKRSVLVSLYWVLVACYNSYIGYYLIIDSWFFLCDRRQDVETVVHINLPKLVGRWYSSLLPDCAI